MSHVTHGPSAAARRIDGPLVAFFALAFTIAWGAFGIVASIAHRSGLESAQALMAMGETYQFSGVELAAPYGLVYALTRLADFSFSIAGVVMIAATAGRAGLRTLWGRVTRVRIGWGWYAVGFLPVMLYGVATALAGAFPSADFSMGAIATASFSLHAGWFVSLLFRGAMGEELGLRGFALPRLQESHSPFRASVIIGLLWGAWHLPVLIGRDALSVAAFIVLAFGLSFLFTLMFNGSGGSLVPVLLFHATQNWEEGFEVLFPRLLGTDWELAATLALLGIGIVAGFLVWRTGRSHGDLRASALRPSSDP